MDTAAEMAERHAAALRELTELGLVLARELQARALSADTPEEAEKLAAGFHCISRSVRQSMALEARLRRDALRGQRDDLAAAAAEAAQAPTARRAEAKARLDRLIWTEAEDETTAAFWEDGARRLLAEAEFAEDFQTGDVGEIVERLARTLRETAPPQAGPPKRKLTVEWQVVDPRTGAVVDRVVQNSS